jgi:hypothetical protein
VKRQILLACDSLGFQAKEEYRSVDWRADVLVLASATDMNLYFLQIRHILELID